MKTKLLACALAITNIQPTPDHKYLELLHSQINHHAKVFYKYIFIGNQEEELTSKQINFIKKIALICNVWPQKEYPMRRIEYDKKNGQEAVQKIVQESKQALLPFFGTEEKLNTYTSSLIRRMNDKDQHRQFVRFNCLLYLYQWAKQLEGASQEELQQIYQRIETQYPFLDTILQLTNFVAGGKIVEKSGKVKLQIYEQNKLEYFEYTIGNPHKAAHPPFDFWTWFQTQSN